MHTFIVDLVIHTKAIPLKADHRLYEQALYCEQCKSRLHTKENLTEQTWFETEFGNFCTLCFTLPDEVICLEDCVNITYLKEVEDDVS